MSETSLAFHLPTSPLMRLLLDDTNLALSKFLEDQTVHSFLPVPSHSHRRYYRTSSSSFPGPYSVPPGGLNITLEKASEAKKRSFLCLPYRSPRWRLCFMGYARWPHGWTGGCPLVEVSGRICLWKFVPTSRGLFSQDREPWSSWLTRAARLSAISSFRHEIPSSGRPFYGTGGGSCALEVLTSSRDGVSLFVSPAGLSVVQVAGGCQRRSGATYPSSAQDSSEPAAAGGSAGSSSTGSAQVSSSGARPAQKQSSTSSPSGQSGKKRKSCKGKSPFSSFSGGSGRSGGKGKGAGKKST